MWPAVVGAAVPLLVAAAVGLSALLFQTFLPPLPLPPRLVLEPLGSFRDIPGWLDDDPAPALAAFVRSCVVLDRLPDNAPIDPAGLEGRGRDWRAACAQARQVPPGAAAARAFFERAFRPFAAADDTKGYGLFTGYYEPELRGSRTRRGPFRTPLLGVPSDLVAVDLGRFLPDLRGRSIIGRVRDGRLEPYPTRAEIETGALGAAARPLLWVNDPIQAFFLQIQGSGRIVLEDGTVLRVGYAARNGHPYVAIGRILIRSGVLRREGVSLQSIRAWLAAHPDQARSVMDGNSSYVFFRLLGPADPNLGPPGSQDVLLTPGRSLAVDRAYHGLGVPVWLDTTAPAATQGAPDRPLRRLLVAQDTGGAIRGPLRGDVFWGFGSEAEGVAGRMKSQGRMVLLVPRSAGVR